MFLRKGISEIDLDYKNDSDSIGTIKTEINIKDNVAYLKALLKPVDGNQLDDANSFIESGISRLRSVTVRNDYIIDRLGAFLNNHKNEFDLFIFEIDFQGIHQFEVFIEQATETEFVFKII